MTLIRRFKGSDGQRRWTPPTGLVPVEQDTPDAADTNPAADEGFTEDTLLGEAEEGDWPEGAPEPSWTHAELDAYAEAHGVEFPQNANKADKLAALLGDDEE